MKDNVIDVYGNIIVVLRLNCEKRKIRILEKWKEFHQNSTSLYFYRIKPEINQYKSFITKSHFIEVWSKLNKFHGQVEKQILKNVLMNFHSI